jgi:hypothetical protein
MSAGMVGRAISGVGVVVGLLAVSLPFLTVTDPGSGVTLSSRYVDDGTIAAFLIVLLSFASYVAANLAERHLDLITAAGGSAAFGFFLFAPAGLAFDRLGFLGSGAWLGLCSVLIPIGALIAWAAERPPDAAPPPRTAGPPAIGPALILAVGGLVLGFIAIWLPVESGGNSFWNLSSSGHALGILLLLLVLLSAGLVAASVLRPAPATGEVTLLVVSATFGLLVFEWVADAFDELGSLGSGGWIAAIGGLLLIVGVAGLRVAAEPRVGERAGAAAAS